MYWERPTTWTFAVMFTGLISKKMDTISFYRHTLVEQGTKFAVLSTNAALLCDLSDIKFGEHCNSWYLSICPVTDIISATVTRSA